MKTIGLVLGILFFTAACSVTTLTPEVASNLQAGKVASVFYVENKSIKYDEMVYKVLWNETRSQASTFGDFWDVDSDLTTALNSEIRGLGLDAYSVNDILGAESAYQQVITAIENTRDSEGMNVPLKLDQATVQHFKNSNIDYLIVVRAARFMISTTSFNNSGMVNLPALLLIYDVNTGTEEYSEYFGISGGVEWGDSVRNLESNNLALLRENAPQWVQNSVNLQLPKILNQ